MNGEVERNYFFRHHFARPRFTDFRADLLLMLRVLENQPLSEYTTFGIGGRAKYLVKVSNPTELLAAVALAKERRWRYQLIAGGSNVVFTDQPFNGLVIRYFAPRGPVIIRNRTVLVEAGVPLGNLIKNAIKFGLAGLETLSGIPGTVGGAVIGNAGAYGQTISDHLTRVEVWDGKKILWFNKKQGQFDYRESVFKQKNWLVLRAEFQLQIGDRKQLLTKARGIIKLRSKKYKPSLRCPGSFFKNILVKKISAKSLRLIDQAKIIDGKIPAGYLLETVGAKGMKLGDLRVADFHGNLIINAGQATYRDVRRLAARLKNRVYKKFGIKLTEEVRYLD
ncbi:MAG: UDP-N-acetylmuramate dehydrogenase [Patescibacteria group bacterium]